MREVRRRKRDGAATYTVREGWGTRSGRGREVDIAGDKRQQQGRGKLTANRRAGFIVVLAEIFIKPTGGQRERRR